MIITLSNFGGAIDGSTKLGPHHRVCCNLQYIQLKIILCQDDVQVYRISSSWLEVYSYTMKCGHEAEQKFRTL